MGRVLRQEMWLTVELFRQTLVAAGYVVIYRFEHRGPDLLEPGWQNR